MPKRAQKVLTCRLHFSRQRQLALQSAFKENLQMLRHGRSNGYTAIVRLARVLLY